MKKIFKVLMYSAIAAAVVISCAKEETPSGENGGNGGNNTENEGGNSGETDKPAEKPAPEMETVELTAIPTGDTLTFELEAAGAWTIATEEECDWVTFDATSGEGNATVTIYTTPNQSGKDRSVSYYVSVPETETAKAGEIYELFISQLKMELPIVEGDYNFVKWLVDNKAYGDKTPVVEDWYSFNGEGFPGVNFATDAAGKWYIASIYVFCNDPAVAPDAIFNSFPPEVKLSGVTEIYVNYSPIAGGMDITACPLIGSEMPQVWECPMLRKVHLECVGMHGTIPQSFADLPALRAFFVRSCDLYGALPQKWTTKALESIVLGFNGVADCPNLGYLIPAEFDIILNSEKPQEDVLHRDKNELKYGGNRENWQGFEEGWGQKRYERLDPNAVAGDKTTWSDYRGLTDGSEEARNPLGSDNAWYIDAWAWYYTNIKDIPQEMKVWNQADADAYTATAKARARLYSK